MRTMQTQLRGKRFLLPPFCCCYSLHPPHSILLFLLVPLLVLQVPSSSGTRTEKQAPASEDQPFASILYTAVVRGKVALPCDITPPTPDDTVALILWYKDDALTPIYTLDSRKGYLEQARTLTASALDGRAYFNLHNRPAFLHIDPIRLIDAGDYRCRVDFKKARTVNTVISLKVIVPPEEPVITDLEGNELKGLVGPFNEGDQLRLLCSSTGGKPRPSLTWWRDYTIIDDSFEYNDKEVTTNQLSLQSLARHHLLSIFTCQAINNNITVPSSSSITLDLNLKPTEVKITQLSSVLVADREGSFECSTFGSRPKALMTWSFEGQSHVTPLTAGALGEHQTSTTLSLIPRREHHGASISCTAHNPKIQDSSVSDSVMLDVQFVPLLSLTLGSPTISLNTIQEGNDIYFDCNVLSNPPPKQPIVWEVNGTPLTPRKGVIQSNQTLVLQRVSRTQSGSYSCEGTNTQGTGKSNLIHLKIRFAPVCSTDVVLVYGVSLHETVHLPCSVEANPIHVSSNWRFQGTVDLSTFTQVNESSSILKYSPHAPQEFGSIECIAKNDVGLQQKPCKYQIIPAGPPTFPFNCQVMNQSDSSLVIQCVFDVQLAGVNGTNGFGSGHLFAGKWLDQTRVLMHPKTHYVCEVYHLTSSNLLANVSTTISMSHPRKEDSNTFTLFAPNLPAATTVRLKIFALNSKGRSDLTWLRAQTLRPAERLIDSQDSGLKVNLGQSDSNPDASSPSDLEASFASLMDKPVLLTIVSGAFIIVATMIMLGVVIFTRSRSSSSTRSVLTSSNSSQLNGTNHHTNNTDNKPSQGGGGDHNHHNPHPDGHNNHLNDHGMNQSHHTTYFRDGDVGSSCCCEDDYCDDRLLTLPYPDLDYDSKGPPDIIPSFGHYTIGPGGEITATSGPMDVGPSTSHVMVQDPMTGKVQMPHFTHYEQLYHQKLMVESEQALQYAEVAFDPLHTSLTPSVLGDGSVDGNNVIYGPVGGCGGGGCGGGNVNRLVSSSMTQDSTESSIPASSGPTTSVTGSVGSVNSHFLPQPVDYARIEFTKSSRVSVLCGSPKFESTV